MLSIGGQLGVRLVSVYSLGSSLIDSDLPSRLDGSTDHLNPRYYLPSTQFDDSNPVPSPDNLSLFIDYVCDFTWTCLFTSIMSSGS